MRTYGFIYIGFALFIFCIFPNYPLKTPDADPLNEAEIKKLLRDDGVDRSANPNIMGGIGAVLPCT